MYLLVVLGSQGIVVKCRAAILFSYGGLYQLSVTVNMRCLCSLGLSLMAGTQAFNKHMYLELISKLTVKYYGQSVFKKIPKVKSFERLRHWIN